MTRIVLQNRKVVSLVEHEQASDQFKNAIRTLLLKTIFVIIIHVKRKFMKRLFQA